MILVSTNGTDAEATDVDDFIRRLPTMPKGQARVVLPSNHREDFGPDYDENDPEACLPGHTPHNYRQPEG